MKTGLIEQIKEKISCIDYMQFEHGSTIVAGRCKSFRPDAKNATSLMVNARDWYDFGSGLGGDVIDMAAYDKYNGDKGKAIRYLSEKWNLQISHIPKFEIVFKSYLNILDDATTFYQSQLEDKHLDYLHGRGLKQQTIQDLRIGWANNPCDFLKQKGYSMEQIADSGILSFVNRLMVPYLKNGKAVYLIGRQSVWEESQSSKPDAKYTKLYRNEYSEHPIWGKESLVRDGTVIIAEGIFDAIACWQEGYPVITAVTGAFSTEQKKDLLPALKDRNVIVCMDYDPETKAGQKFTEKLADELFEAGINISVVFLNGKGEKIDISQLYSERPTKKTLECIFASAQNWEDIIINRIADIEDAHQKQKKLKDFLQHCAVTFDYPTVAQLIENAKQTGMFDLVWLKEVARELRKSSKLLSEIQMVKQFQDKYECVFHAQIGWYEYAGTVWKKITEFEVRQHIADLYGELCTAKNVDSVYKLLKNTLLKTDLFNQQIELLNFPNGMFNIETGEMQPHDKKHYSNIQMAYEYVKGASCPQWLQFIKDVTNDDEGRQLLLQEMFGYCLTRDVRYQKCFCLIGTGANGKSVLLNILESMVGEANTSHVEIAYLQSDFQRIGLLNSLVNICNDMQSDVTGTDAFFKAIVAGDPITACYKGKDFINFKPFCKMIFSTNKMLTTRDVDYSVLRRFCFLDFPIRFVDGDSGKPNEKPKDPYILDKLLPELPGIFNWAYSGLQALRKQDKFTSTQDQEDMGRAMEVLNNPIISFVEDVIGNGAPQWQNTMSRREIYREYKQWCADTNTKQMSARSFWPRLRSIFPYEELKTCGDRYITFTEPFKYCGETCGDTTTYNF